MKAIDLKNPENTEKTNSHNPSDEITVTQRVVGWLWFFFKLGLVLGCISVLLLGGIMVGLIRNFSEKVPIIADDSYKPNLTSVVYDRNGKIIAKLHAEENRTRILSSQEIPTSMKAAVVAIEDERFYGHYGIDVMGIARAMLTNIKAGKIRQGASTLTQQLVKNAFLTNEKTLQRKAIEAMMAFQIERKYSKDEILTLYLNEIYFGHGVYGLAAATELYYGKEPKDLTIAECAILAGIPKSPVAYSPIRNPKRNEERKTLVLDKMAELGFITPAQYQDAKAEVVAIRPLSESETKAPYFTAYVRDQMLEKYGASLLYGGGLKIYTSLDLDLQEYAEAAMASATIFAEYPMDKFPDLNGSLVCINPKNGHIMAMYGGRDFNASQFNRVTQALRQPGSSFKPFVYACALQEGMLPSDMILDEPISYTNPWTKQVWTPKNYDLRFHGDVTMMKAVSKSYNIPAVKLIDKLTPAKVIRTAKRMGVTSHMQPNLSLALGSGQFTPLEMASAYGVVANGGVYCPPLAILKVLDRENTLIEENLPNAREVMKALDAAMMCDLLKNVVERGSGARARIVGKVIGGKTGTTNNYVDAWFNGITTELVTIVQFGFDMPKTLGKGKAGGSVCGPVWKSFMEKALAKYPSSDFPVPEGGVRCKVCMTSGKLASSACPAIEVVTQVFPIESQPLTECRHSQYLAAAATSSLDDEEVDQAYGYGAMPDAGFFSDNYQTDSMPSAMPGYVSSPVNLNNQGYQSNQNQVAPNRGGFVPATGWYSRDAQNNLPQNNLPQNSQNLQNSLPQNQPLNYQREPGVFIENHNNRSTTTPKIEFQDDYF
jgi:penicillin-binding protein 1A